MNRLNKIKLSGFKPFLLSALLMLFLVGCGGGGDKKDPPSTGKSVPTILGTALIPGGKPIQKAGLFKILPAPGEGAFVGSKVRARSLTTGIAYDSFTTVGEDGTFQIKGILYGDDYLVSARKGDQLVSKLVTIPGNLAEDTPFDIGQIDLSTTVTVRRVERDLQDEFPDEDVNFQVGETNIYTINIINAIHLADPEGLFAALLALAQGVVDDSGQIIGTADLNAFFKENGVEDTDKISSINIYLTLYQLLIGGDPNANLDVLDVIAKFINGGSGNINADKVIININGDVINIINVTVAPDNFRDYFDPRLTETTITSGPSNPTEDDFATFFFISNRLNSTFKCSLDGVASNPCTSPIDYTGIATGQHTFSVVATGPDGKVDPSPALHTWTVGTTIRGSALSFDGNDLVTFGTVTPLFKHTIEAWIKPKSPTGGVVVGHIAGPTAACGFGFQLLAGDNRLSYNVDPAGCGTNNFQGHNIDTLDVWTHIAGTFDGSVAKLFVNGQVVSELTGVTLASSTWMTAGGQTFFNGPQGFFTGEIDEIRVWDFPRSAQEIRDTMNRPLQGTEPGLVGYWNFNEGSGQNVVDMTSSNVTGVLGTNANVQANDPTWVASGAPIFAPGTPFNLKLNVAIDPAGTGNGTVTATGINCPGDCTEAYANRTQVILTAASAADSIFTGWTGGVCLGTVTCTVTMNADQNVTATFDLKPPTDFTLNVTIDPTGTGGGAVTSSPAGISCGVDCTQDYPDGTLVTLTATPNVGSVFVGWTGSGCSGVGTCAVTMDAAKPVTAKFDVVVVVPEPNTVIDTKPPNPDVLSSAVFTFHATVNGVNETGATFECKLDTPGTWVACPSPKTYTSLVDGSHIFMVRAKFGGKTDQTPASWTWTISAPPNTFIDDGPTNPTHATSATFIFSSNKAGATFECELDGTGTTFLPCVSGKTYDPVTVAAHVFKVRATDPATGMKDPTPATRNWTVEPPVGACTTLVPTGLVSGETWTSAGSPYCVQGDIQVTLLTINPGVEVRVDGAFEIRVLSTITAIGTVDQPILFSSLTPDAPTSQRWKGIKFQNTPPGSELTHVNIEFSDDSGITLIDSHTPSLNNCIIRNNSKTGSGGGMSMEGIITGDLVLRDCTFSGNTASVNGGALQVNLSGIFKLDIQNSLFENNTANPAKSSGNFVGGALYLEEGGALINKSVFKGNLSISRCTGAPFTCFVTARGGAIFISGAGIVTIENSEIRTNKTEGVNSGDCRFSGGGSNGFGGGLYVDSGSLTLRNSIVSGNETIATNCRRSLRGSGLYVNGGTVTVENSTIARNIGSPGAFLAGGTLDITNSILFFNNNDGLQIGGTPTVTFSDVQGGFTGVGNINFNPVFSGTGLLANDFKLALGSPATDAGDPALEFNDVCFPPSLGTALNDMGAYGGPLACNWPN